MSYSNSAAVLRPDINGVVEEAAAAQDFYIGAQVFPEWSSDTKSGQYPVFKKGTADLLNDDATLRKPGGSYGEVKRAYENDTFDCKDRGLEEPVDDTESEDLSRFFDVEASAARHTMTQVMLGHEVRVSAAVMNTTNFGSATSAAVDYTQANIATIDFVQDILAAIDRLNNKGEKPNTIVMSGPVWNRTSRSTLFQNWLRGSRPTDSQINVTPMLAANSFSENGIKNVLVGRAAKNSAKKGQSYSGTPIWGNTYIWIGRVESGPALFDGGAGRTIVWNKEGGLFVTETYRNEKRRSDMVRVRQNTAEKVLDGEAGELIATSYA